MAATADDLFAPKLDGLPPSKRHKQLALFARDAPKDIVNQVLRTHQPNIHPQDYGELLFHVRHGERTLAALHSPWPSTRSWAVKALAHQWNEGSRVAQEIGATQLADVLGSIPFDDAKNLASRLFRYHGEGDPRTAILDELVALIAPSLFPGKSAIAHPTCRLASVIVPRLLPALSSSTASQIIDAYGTIPSSSLRTLTKLRPEIVVACLSLPRERGATTKIELSGDWLRYIFAFRKPPRMPISAMEVDEGSGSHWGTEAFLSLLEKAGNARIQFIPTPSLVCSAAVIALRASRSEDQRHRIIVPVLKALHNAHNGDPASTRLNTVQRFVLAIFRKTAKSDTGKVYEDYIKQLGKISILPNQGLDSSALHFILNPLPAHRRLLVLNLLYGEPLGTSKTFRCPPQLLHMLPPADGIEVLASIRRNFPEKPFSSERWPDTTSPVINQYTALSRVAFRSDQSIYETALRHSWGQDDGSAREAFVDLIAHWKVSAHRELDATKRATAATLVIRITDLSGDSKLVLEAYKWVSERFEKDRNVQDHLFRGYDGHDLACLAGHKSNLVQSARDGDEVLLLLLENLRRSQREPDAHPLTQYHSSLRGLISRTLQARIHLLDRHSVSEGDAYAILSPLGQVLLAYLRLTRTDQATYGSLPYWPHLYETPWLGPLEVSKRMAAPVIRMLDEIGMTTEEEYERIRSTVPVDGEIPKIYAPFKRWPWVLGVQPAGNFVLPCDQAPFLNNYLEKVLFQPISEATEVVPERQVPLLDAENEQWANALDMYLKIAKDRQERERRILAVWSHYLQVPFPRADEEGETIMDLSSLILLSSQAQKTILKSEELVDLFISPVFPSDMASNQYKIGENLPPASHDWPRRIDEDCCLCIRVGEFEPSILLKWALTSAMRLPASRVLKKRIAIAGGIMLSYTIPHEPYHPPARTGVTPGSQVDVSVLTFPARVIEWIQGGYGYWGDYRQLQAVAISLLRGSDALSKEEFKSIIARIENLDIPEYSEPHRERCMRLLATRVLPRTAFPGLLEERVFHFLKDKTKSTTHRLWFSTVLLRCCPPTESVRLLDRLFGIVTKGLAYDIEEEETQGDAVESEFEKPRPSTNTSVKITTVKHLVVMLASLASGLSIAAVCSRLTALFEATSHPSVQSALLWTSMDLLIQGGPIIAAPDMDVIFGQLERITLRVCGLDGKTFLTEENWSREVLPVIDPDNTAVVGVFSLSKTQVPTSFVKRYINIVEKMHVLQTKNSKRWMAEFMQRNAASKEELRMMEDFPFGPLLNLRGYLGEFVRTWRRELPQDSALIRLTYDLPTTFLRGSSLRPFLERLHTKSMQFADKRLAQDFKNLVGIWDEHDEHFSIIVHCLSHFGNQEDSDAIKDICATLLLPANKSVVPGGLSNPRSTMPNNLLLAFIDHLKPQEIKSPTEREAWLKHVRPLVAWLREKVKADQSTGIPGTRFNVGAANTRLLVKLEVLLLPYPILGLSPSNPHMAFAEALVQIGLNAIHQPLSFLNLPHLLESMLNYFDDTDAEPLLQALVTVFSKTKRNEDRVLIVLLIKTVASLWRLKETIWEKLCGIAGPLATDEDEAVRVLAIPMTPSLPAVL